MTTALAIDSTKKNENIAIGEPVDYTITATDYVAGDQVSLQLRKVSDNSAVITKTVTLSGASTSGNLSGTWILKTSQTVGNYYLYCELSTDSTINTGSACITTCVLLTPWMLTNVYMAGIPFEDFQHNTLSDAVAETCVETAIGQLEEDTKIFWYIKTVIADPEPGDTYDYEIDKLTYVKRDMRGLGIITFPHFMVQSVTELKGYLASVEAIDIPVSWLEINKKRGTVHIIPSTATSATITGTIGTSLLIGNVVENLIPAFWKPKYTAGWDESAQNFEKGHLQALGIRATLNATPILSDAIKPGVSSTSLSMDGLSESEGTTASAIYALLSAREKTYKDQYNAWLRKFIRRYRGPAFSVG